MNKTVQRALFCSMLAFSPVSYSANVAEYLTSAQQHIEKHEVKAAVIQLKNALQKEPNSVEARLLLGEVYLDNGDPAAAEKELKRAEKLGADKEQVGLLLARAYLMLGKFDDVLNKIDLGDGASASGKAELLSYQGAVHSVKGDQDKANSVFKSALKLDPASSSAKLGLARLDAATGKVDAAAEIVADVLATDKENVDAWILKGELALSQGKMNEIHGAFEKALELSPHNMQAKLGLATSWIQKGDSNKAKSLIDSVLAVIPMQPKANYLDALVGLQKEDFEAASEALNKVLKVTPGNVPASYLLGAIRYTKQEYEQAEYYLSQVIATAPEHDMARKLLGAVYAQMRQPLKTVEVLSVIKESHADDPQLLSLLGVAYIQTGRQGEGVVLLEKASEIAPDAANVRAQLAIGRLASGDVESAVHDLEKAIDIDGSLTQAELTLIFVHLREEKFDKAVEEANKLIKKNPSDPIGYNLRGLAYMGKKDEKSAQSSFNEALKIDDNFHSARINLAQMELKKGNISGGEKYYKQIISKDSKNVSALKGLAKISASQKDMKKALSWLEKAQEVAPNDLEVVAMLVEAYLRDSAPLKATKVAREGAENNEGNPTAYEIYGRVQMATKDFASAIVTYKKLFDITKENPKAGVLLGEAYIQAEDYRGAQSVARKVIDAAPDNMVAQMLLFRSYMLQEKFDNALRVAKTVRKAFPDEHIGYELQGDVHWAKENAPEALKSYKTGLGKKEVQSLVIKLYRAYKNQEKDSEALNTVEGWLKKNPLDAKVGMLAASEYQAVNDVEKAKLQYQKVLEAQPNNVAALNNLAWMYGESGDKRGVALAQKAYDLSKDNPAVMDTYGWVLVKTGKPKEAINILKETLLKAPNMMDVRYHLAYAYYKVGDNDSARKELKWLKQFGYSDKAKLNELESFLSQR